MNVCFCRTVSFLCLRLRMSLHKKFWALFLIVNLTALIICPRFVQYFWNGNTFFVSWNLGLEWLTINLSLFWTKPYAQSWGTLRENNLSRNPGPGFDIKLLFLCKRAFLIIHGEDIASCNEYHMFDFIDCRRALSMGIFSSAIRDPNHVIRHFLRLFLNVAHASFCYF